ncbi:site-specific recombinase, phage integrase family [Rhodobacteraceae bacterium KLH11]|nr:site-specific recombinase, phage integrase family [Rhodobacteraceae bacterium KLH11]
MNRAEEWRRRQFEWFNEIFEQSAKEPEVVEELTDALIATMAREVYLDYRAEVDDDLSDFLAATSEEQAANEIPEEDRKTVLRDLLASFDPIASAKLYAGIQLKSKALTISPDNPSYARLVQRIREAFIQVHVDFVNNYSNTPGQDDNPFFVDTGTKEPIPPAGKNSSKPASSYKLSDQATQLKIEVSNSRGSKGIAKIENTMTLMQDWFGKDYDIRRIGRVDVVAFRDALLNVPTNMAKRYPRKKMTEGIKLRRPEHPTLSISSVNTHLRNVVQLFNNAQRYDDDFRPPNLTKLKIPDPVDDQDKRFPFSTDRLRILFGSIADKGSNLNEDHLFWCSVIALYHGLRANEIGELAPEDITTAHGTLCINVRLPKAIVDGTRKGRTKTIPRLLPMHPVLVNIGLPKFANGLIDQPHLFPNLREDKDGYRSDDMTDWASKRISSLGWSGEKLSFHSFRHNFLDAMDEAEISEKWKAHLGGWKLPGVMNKTYGSKEMKENLIPAIAKVTYGKLDGFLKQAVAQASF